MSSFKAQIFDIEQRKIIHIKYTMNIGNPLFKNVKQATGMHVYFLTSKIMQDYSFSP